MAALNQIAELEGVMGQNENNKRHLKLEEESIHGKIPAPRFVFIMVLRVN